MSYKREKLNEAIPSEYIQRIKRKNKIRYILGFLIRFKKHLINRLATSCVILPSVTRIETQSIIGAFSVLVRNSNEDGVYSGNPAKELRKHEGRFDKLVVCSLKGGDYNYYKCVYKL